MNKEFFLKEIALKYVIRWYKFFLLISIIFILYIFSNFGGNLLFSLYGLWVLVWILFFFWIPFLLTLYISIYKFIYSGDTGVLLYIKSILTLVLLYSIFGITFPPFSTVDGGIGGYYIAFVTSVIYIPISIFFLFISFIFIYKYNINYFNQKGDNNNFGLTKNIKRILFVGLLISLYLIFTQTISYYVAIKLNNTNLCPNYGNLGLKPLGAKYKDNSSCYKEIAIKHDNTQACDDIVTILGFNNSHCYALLKEKYNDTSYCDVLGNQDYEICMAYGTSGPTLYGNMTESMCDSGLIEGNNIRKCIYNYYYILSRSQRKSKVEKYWNHGSK